MEIAVLLFILLIGPLAVLFGADSRRSEPGPARRGWFPTTPSR